ncbi:hypothetical protein [Nioella sp. MMSF_3534]|uniref:hypothetical protein n=1 Tax=Nioella sp. MMSF_3534 TaxID=3046720 RepID=UPI00273EAE66|nr:hypothetical protein [Nioella sp. MMSF_3534]
MGWETLLAGCVSLLVGVVIYATQKYFDRREQVRARHFAAYVEMVQSICELANAHNRNGVGKEDALSGYATAKMKFAIVASDGAMKKLVEFDRLITSGDRVPHDKFDCALSDFMLEVRRENIGSTSIPVEEIITITPFGKSLRG